MFKICSRFGTVFQDLKRHVQDLARNVQDLKRYVQDFGQYGKMLPGGFFRRIVIPQI